MKSVSSIEGVGGSFVARGSFVDNGRVSGGEFKTYRHETIVGGYNTKELPQYVLTDLPLEDFMSRLPRIFKTAAVDWTTRG